MSPWKKQDVCTSPLLPPDLESGSRPNHSAGPTRLHNVHPHSAVCQEGRGTEKPVECGRSHYQRLIPGKEHDKMLGCEDPQVFICRYIFFWCLFTCRKCSTDTLASSLTRLLTSDSSSTIIVGRLVESWKKKKVFYERFYGISFKTVSH